MHTHLSLRMRRVWNCGESEFQYLQPTVMLDACNNVSRNAWTCCDAVRHATANVTVDVCDSIINIVATCSVFMATKLSAPP